MLGSRVVIDPAIYGVDEPDANITGLMGSERDGGYAEYVIAISSGYKIQTVLDADVVVVVDRATDAPQQVRAAAPNGVDVVLDVVAGDLAHDRLPPPPLLSRAGRVVVAGALGAHTIGFDVRDLYLHNLQLIGSTMHTPEHFELLKDMVRRAEFTPLRRSKNLLVAPTSARSCCTLNRW